MHTVYTLLILCFGGSALAQDVDIQVELQSPLGTQTSRKGDRVTARVVSPAALAGDIAEGTVTEVRSGSKLGGKAVLNFSFETIQHGGQAISVSTQIRSFTNSRGRADVDDEGRVIRKNSNLGKAAAGTAAGGLIGGLTRGVKGAAIGAGVGAAASIAVIEITADAPEVRFGPGSRITLSCKSRGGPSLASLAPNASTPAPVQQAPMASPSSPAPVQQAAAATETAAPAATGAGAAGAVQPDFTALKDDFIPGEKTILFDDFTDMAPDEAPPHWKTRGSTLALMSAGNLRQVVAEGEVRMYPLFKNLPQNFTVETEVKLNNGIVWNFYAKADAWEANRGELSFHFWREIGNLHVEASGGNEKLVTRTLPCDFSKPIKLGIWVQDGRVRAYANGEKLGDANHVELPAFQKVLLNIRATKQSTVALTQVRVAESIPDFSKVIAADGRYVSHGIHFDTDSDRLKPESGAVIKSIAAGLQKNPNLKLRIEGYTDSVGNAGHNKDLSRRRAESVKTVLVSQFQIDAERLTADGLGAEKPIDSNDTPTGRAQNRRVEFVRQ
jgi:outer membrane protein OmpA-like peptidoglycan-associated protein